MNTVGATFRSLAATCAACLVASAPTARAQLLADELPPELEGVGIVERLDEKIPLDLRFTDETGKPVTLADYFNQGKPVLLTINYYTCPMLCDLMLSGMVYALNNIEWSAGNEFEIVTVSMNPKEETSLAEVKKRAYLTQYQRESAQRGWHFHTGTQENIDALCKAVGFGYRFDDRSGEYAHTSTIMFLTPDGRISRYMNDVKLEPRDVRLALVEASEGAIGSAMDHFLLMMCFQYDPESNSYAASAVKIMRLGGVLTVMLMAAGFGLLWWRGGHARHEPDQDPDARLNLQGAHRA